MSNFVSLEYCEFHEDDSPSMAIYDDEHYHCFGCDKTGQVADLKLDITIKKREENYVEDIKQTFTYINTLPTKSIRGLELPYDDVYYYLTWPNDTYYLARFIDPQGRGKYRCPTGHKRPTFLTGTPNSTVGAIIVEGEFNAASLALALPEFAIGSPGSATELGKFTFRSEVPILIVADADKPGAIGAIKCKSYTDAKIHLMDRDANNVLVTQGKGTLRDEIIKAFYG